MNNISPPALAAAKFLALTGSRLGEAANLCWADIDAATRTARLSDTKTGASIRPLSHAAIAVIKDLPRSGDLVFSSAEGKALAALSKTVRRIIDASGLPAAMVLPHLRGGLRCLFIFRRGNSRPCFAIQREQCRVFSLV